MKPFLLFLFVVTITSCQTGIQDKTKTNQKPNILFFFADDQRADALGCAGNPYIKTPHIDKLAESGVHFRNT